MNENQDENADYYGFEKIEKYMKTSDKISEEKLTVGVPKMMRNRIRWEIENGDIMFNSEANFVRMALLELIRALDKERESKYKQK